MPAFPDNGADLQGHLFVGSELLEHSPMRHHPLTPMTASRSPTSSGRRPAPLGEVHLATVHDGPAAIRSALDAAVTEYVVVDAVANADLVAIAAATADDVLRSGGSGLALGSTPGDADTAAEFTAPVGRHLVVCGSASARTREQIAAAVAAGSPTYRIDVELLAADGSAVVHEAVAWLRAQPADSAPVIYSVGTPSDVSPDTDSAARIEAALSEVVERAVADGFTRCIVAGGRRPERSSPDSGSSGWRSAQSSPPACAGPGTHGSGAPRRRRPEVRELRRTGHVHDGMEALA